MSDSEKPLKIISIIVSGLLVASALLFFVFGQRELVEAEVVMEYSAPSGFDPSELTAALNALRKDKAFLGEVAIRSGYTDALAPEFDRLATGLASRMTFETNWKESSIAIRFSHRKPVTAVNVATAVAAVAKENLEAQRRTLAVEIIRQEDAVEDRRKLLEQILRTESLKTGDLRTESGWGPGYATFVDPKNDYESALRRLAELKAEHLVSVGAIRSATLPSD